jgi:hypothetical protein
MSAPTVSSAQAHALTIASAGQTNVVKVRKQGLDCSIPGQNARLEWSIHCYRREVGTVFSTGRASSQILITKRCVFGHDTEGLSRRRDQRCDAARS